MICNEVYRLIDKNGIAIFEFRKAIERYFCGELYQITSFIEDEPCDFQFVAEVSIKWGGCSHWNFYGQDYSEDNKDIDGYYHICGGSDYMDFMRGIAFVCKLAKENIEEFDKEEFEEIEKLNLLDGYTIVKVEE